MLLAENAGWTVERSYRPDGYAVGIPDIAITIRDSERNVLASVRAGHEHRAVVLAFEDAHKHPLADADCLRELRALYTARIWLCW